MEDIIQLTFTSVNPTLVLVPVTPSEATAEFAAAIVGERGPKGDAGDAVIPPWVQTVPLSVWTIPHNLNRYPVLAVVDTQNNLVITDIRYVDSNIVQVIADSPFAGTAYLN